MLQNHKIDQPWMPPGYEAGLVSVIIPTYNRANLLVASMESVRLQSYRPIELIIVDDGSTDDTSEVVRRWRAQAEEPGEFRVKYVYQSNGTPPGPKSRGIQESCGEWLQFLDSDDLLARHKIARQVETLLNADAHTAAIGPCYWFGECEEGLGVYFRRGAPASEDFLEAWLLGWCVPPHCLLWRRSDTFEQGPWRQELRPDDDGEYARRFLAHGGRFVFTPRAVSYYRNVGHGQDRLSRMTGDSALRTRMLATRLTQRQLVESGRLTETYLDAIAMRYYVLGRTHILSNPALAKLCLRYYRRRAPRGPVPGGRLHRLLNRVLGLRLSELATGMLRRWIGRTRSNRPPRFTVSDEAALCTRAVDQAH